MSPLPPPPAARASSIAIAALVVGIAAFVLGLVPVLGILIALAGIILGILAMTKPGAKVLPVIGMVLSGIAVLANIGAIIFVLTLAPSALPSDYQSPTASDDSEPVELSLSESSTPCFSFDAPEEFISNQSSDDDALCFATREGWGELGEDGTITYTGVGAVWDQVLVEPVRVTTSDTMAPDGDVDTMVDYLETNYFPDLGEIISLREPVTLDGQVGNITYLDSSAETTVTKATIVVKSPEPYDTANGPVQFFLVTFVIDDDRGDEIIDAAVSSWSWK